MTAEVDDELGCPQTRFGVTLPFDAPSLQVLSGELQHFSSLRSTSPRDQSATGSTRR